MIETAVPDPIAFDQCKRIGVNLALARTSVDKILIQPEPLHMEQLA